ncbi:Collagen beta(1-O)galactosyltransferase 1 [Hyphodiscus hymeniophilus]|uniref:Collagen beta(1-O)galactosyltransferase 1 n=1 Tax=Hyphodiscus hymeniophilus TaxID=353542 RepID=A0A9P6SN14_9HELO|nr:Collagen beta(1-O)galactosyltransferase 1 [Hyphodiscus hymeniophilus]
MANRSDKRDAIALSAYLSGLQVEFIDGVDPSTIPEKAYPQNWKITEDEPPGTLGCWRGHMNIYRKMLNENIQTAMVMEDDVDWDVMIKAQMTEVARGARYLQKAPASTSSPYGDSWDLMVTGHCGMWNHVNEDQEYWVINDDPTVIPAQKRTWWRKPNLTAPVLAGDRTRLVLSPNFFTCTGSYAISIAGAARAIYDQAVLPKATAIDMGLGKICRKHEYGFSTCLGTYPMITGIHRQAGSVAKDSDRTDRKAKAHKPDRKVAQSDNLMYPVRLNLGSLLSGDTVVKAQYPQHAMFQEIDISTLKLPQGNAAFVRKEEYTKLNKKQKRRKHHYDI